MSNNDHDLKFTTAGEYIKTEASSDSLLIDSTDQDMNERIRELAEQAGHTPLEPRTFADDLNEIFLQKFAELIVRECANYITEYYPHSRYEAFYMKKHFGVEE
jgi:hypothetical protein